MSTYIPFSFTSTTQWTTPAIITVSSSPLARAPTFTDDGFALQLFAAEETYIPPFGGHVSISTGLTFTVFHTWMGIIQKGMDLYALKDVFAIQAPITVEDNNQIIQILIINCGHEEVKIHIGMAIGLLTFAQQTTQFHIMIEPQPFC